MPAAFAPIDRDVLTGFRQSDERAFERIVRDEFDALHAQAQAELGESAAAGRVAEGALLAAWEARDQIETPTQLEYFLKDAVHRGAVRERSRRAMLHRFQSHEGTARPHEGANVAEDAEQAWAHVRAVLHAPPPTSEGASHLREDSARHGAASHVASIATRGPRFSLQQAALGAVVVIAVVAIIGAGLAWGAGGTEVSRVDDALASADARVVNTRAGQRARMDLADGSATEVGAGTTMRVAPDFAERVRAVGLDGTATFTVTPESQGRFYVRAGNARVRATGTVFDVSAYADDTLVLVRVREGEVRIGSGDSATTVTAGRTMAVDRAGAVRDAPAPLVEEAFAWVDGNFVAIDRPLRELIPMLRRWYDTDLRVTSPELADRRATVRAPLTSSREAIEALQLTAGVGYGQRQGQPVLFDAKTGQ